MHSASQLDYTSTAEEKPLGSRVLYADEELNGTFFVHCCIA